jgi:long-chain acyl-CoA synthetase
LAGRLKIVDRVKHIFKLSQGEYIAPEKIENIYLRCSLVAQVFIYGNSFKSCIVGIIVPDEVALLIWSKKNEIQSKSFHELCRNRLVKQKILADLLQTGKENGLNSLEQVKDVYLHHELFTMENNLLTANQKSKRYELQKYFQMQIDEMYKNLD